MTARSESLGVDTGWLVHLAIEEHPGHESVVRQFTSLRTQDVRFGLAPQVLWEFVHVVTDGRRFLQPVSMVDAIHFAETWWSADNVDRLYPTEGSLQLAWNWMRQFQLGRKRILDTHLAAMWHIHSVVRVLTPNAADYGIFGVFDILDGQSNV